MRLKLLQKEQYKKTPEAIDDLIGNKGVAKLEKFKKIRNKIIQRQLQNKSPKEKQNMIDNVDINIKV